MRKTRDQAILKLYLEKVLLQPLKKNHGLKGQKESPQQKTVSIRTWIKK